MLNSNDIWARIGLPRVRIPLTHILGTDSAGVVVVVGSEVRGVAVGDEVITYGVNSCRRRAAGFTVAEGAHHLMFFGRLLLDSAALRMSISSHTQASLHLIARGGRGGERSLATLALERGAIQLVIPLELLDDGKELGLILSNGSIRIRSIEHGELESCMTRNFQAPALAS
ncbi:MAG: hypothetical protein ACI841_003039 [Planctomycetota bacterium]